MTLSDISIRRPVFAWMLMLGLIAFGLIGANRMGVNFLPDVDFPILTISVKWPGAAPQVMETEIVDRLEQSVRSAQGLKNVTSSIQQGYASIVLEFDIRRNIDVALQEVQSAVATVELPKDVLAPRILKFNPEDQPIVWLGVTGQNSLHELIAFADLHLKDAYQILPGVGELLTAGVVDRNLRIWVSNEKLAKYDLSILDVQRAIELEHIETAAGVIENSTQEMNIRAMGEGLSPEQVGNILITQRGGQPVYKSTIHIKDVARVEDGLDDLRRFSRVTGKPGIGLGIKKQKGVNSVEVAKLVHKKTKELNEAYKGQVNISVGFDATVYIQEAVHETIFTLFLSAICTGLVCWLFLGSWSSTFNVLLSIPTSIIGSFMLMYLFGFSMNIFSLLGLALAVGIVVDDAIMVLENIYRHQEAGKTRLQAAIDGAREITFATVASSVAVIAVFLPVTLVGGIMGKFLLEFGVTISVAVVLSLLEAITLTPMRCSQFLETSQQAGKFAVWVDQKFKNISAQYQTILQWCLENRWTVILGSLGIFIVSLFTLGGVQKEFSPTQDQSSFMIQIEAPVGSSLNFTDQKFKEVEKFILSQKEMESYFAAIGGIEGLPNDVNNGIIFVTLLPKSKRSKGHLEIMDLYRKELGKIKDVKITLVDFSKGGFSPGRAMPVDFDIRGGDWDVLKEKGAVIMKQLQATGMVTDLDTDFKEGMPEIRVVPDREKAAARGVTIDSLVRTINTSIGGIRQGKFTKDGRRYDVRIRLNPEDRLQADSITNLAVRNSHGELIPMPDIVSLEKTSAMQSINRKNRERSVAIFANVAPGKSETEVFDKIGTICKETLPPGYRMYLSGAAETAKEAGAGFMFALLLGILVAYMVLASQFNSFLHPISVLLPLPFSITGVFFALLICRQSLNLYSAIGIILLMGIVKKNSILLVEFTNQKRYRDGLPLNRAILEAGPIRLRPILMTTFATIAAAIPPAFAIGPGAETRIPMSVAIIGGIIISTVFTLLVVPCAYSLLARFERSKPMGINSERVK